MSVLTGEAHTWKHLGGLHKRSKQRQWLFVNVKPKLNLKSPTACLPSSALHLSQISKHSPALSNPKVLLLGPLIGSASKHKRESNRLPRCLTPLDREAFPVFYSFAHAKEEFYDAVEGLVEALDQAGVTRPYAFEFVRTEHKLVEDLLIEAKSLLASSGASSTAECLTAGLPAEICSSTDSQPEAGDCSLADQVASCARNRDIPALLGLLELIGVETADVCTLLSQARHGLKDFKARLQFLDSIGITSHQAASVLTLNPQILAEPLEKLTAVVAYLRGLRLDEKDIKRLIVKEPKVLTADIFSEIESSVNSIKSLNISDSGVQKLVKRYPALLVKNNSLLDPLVGYLQELGVQRDNIGPMLVQSPALLGRSIDTCLRPMGDFLQRLGCSGEDMDIILSRFPSFFSYNLEQDLVPVVDYFLQLGVRPEEIPKMFRRLPKFLKYRAQFPQKVKFLLSLGLQRDELAEILVKAPRVLTANVAKNLQPKVAFLESLDVTGQALIKVLKTAPTILALSLEDQWLPSVEFLESLGCKPDQIGRMVTRYPQLLGMGVEEKLRPAVVHLLHLGFARHEISLMAPRFPALLSLNFATVIAPKYYYARYVMGCSRAEIVSFPQYFSYSLEGRIRRRYERIAAIGRKLSLSRMLALRELDFDRIVKVWEAESW